MDRWVIYTCKHFRPLLCIQISLYLCWNLCDLSFGATLFPWTTNVAWWQNWTFRSLNRSMRETTGKSTHLKIEQMVRKKPQATIETVYDCCFACAYLTVENDTSASSEKDLTKLHLYAFLGTTRNDVRGTVETAKPVLRIWAQRPQSIHASLQQRSVFDLFLLFTFIWLCSCGIFGVRNYVRPAWEG